MRMNIQPIFVFDGPRRPWKRGGTAGFISWEKIDLLRKVLDNLKIPHHRAPAEAEAECARLEQLGIVDAVWSDDSDSFMFGASTLIRSHFEQGKKTKSDTHVTLYRATELHAKFGLNRPALIMFALLSGGDYDTKGLEGCGPKVALAAVQWNHGVLGQLVNNLDLKNLQVLNKKLTEYFREHAARVMFVPPGFPRDLHVKNYRSPVVSSEEECHNLRGLKKGWHVPIDEYKLRPFLRERFNFRAREYINHIVPVLLVQHLVRSPSDDHTNFNIKFIHKRGKTADDYKMERLLVFDPLVCSNLSLFAQPAGEDWSIWDDKKTGRPWDPSEPVEMEILDCYLRKALGPAEMDRLIEDASQPKSRKRKEVSASDDVEASVAGPATKKAKKTVSASDDEASSTARPATKKAKKTSSKNDTATSAVSASANTASDNTQPKPRKKRSKKTSPSRDVSPPSEPPKFRMPSALSSLSQTERSQLQEEGINVWDAPPSPPRRSDFTTTRAPKTKRKSSSTATVPPAAERVDSGLATPEGYNFSDSGRVKPKQSLQWHHGDQTTRICELITKFADEMKKEKFDKLYPAQQEIDATVKTTRTQIRHVMEMNDGAMKTGKMARETFAEGARCSAARQAEVHEQCRKFLQDLDSAISEHEEAFARVFAIRRVQMAKSRASQEEIKASLVNDMPDVLKGKKDLEILKLAVTFQVEIYRALHPYRAMMERLQAMENRRETEHWRSMEKRRVEKDSASNSFSSRQSSTQPATDSFRSLVPRSPPSNSMSSRQPSQPATNGFASLSAPGNPTVADINAPEYDEHAAIEAAIQSSLQSQSQAQKPNTAPPSRSLATRSPPRTFQPASQSVTPASETQVPAREKSRAELTREQIAAARLRALGISGAATAPPQVSQAAKPKRGEVQGITDHLDLSDDVEDLQPLASRVVNTVSSQKHVSRAEKPRVEMEVIDLTLD